MNIKRFVDCVIEPVNDIGGLFISGIEEAESEIELKKYKISAVLSVLQSSEVDSSFFRKIDMKHKIIEVIDTEKYDISKHFDEANDFIANELAKGNVLVHCYHGMARSPTIVISYLIRHKKMDFNNAYVYLQNKRPIICLPESYQDHLKIYEKSITKQIYLMFAGFCEQLSNRNRLDYYFTI